MNALKYEDVLDIVLYKVTCRIHSRRWKKSTVIRKFIVNIFTKLNVGFNPYLAGNMFIIIPYDLCEYP